MQTIVMDSKIIEVINIASQYPSIKRMGIFGSYARGEQTTNSDIDILYDYNDLMIHDTIKCLGIIQKKINTSVDFIAYDDLINTSNDYDTKLKDNILNDVIWIYNNNHADEP